MNPLRVDAQSFQLPLPTARNTGAAKSESDNAFSQILDQQLNTQNDRSDPPRSRQSPAPRDEAPRDREAPETKAKPRQSLGRRRDDKSPTNASAPAQARKSGAKSADQKPETTESAASSHGPQKTTPKSQPDDPNPASDTAAAPPAAPDASAATPAPDPDGDMPNGDPNAQQQPGDSGDQSLPKPQPGDAAALDGNALAVQSLPQGIAILKLSGSAAAQTTAAKAAAPVAPAGLIIAASQAPVLQALAPDAQDSAEDPVAGGLKFDLVVPNGPAAPKPQGIGSAAAATDSTGAADANSGDGSAADTNPANTALPIVPAGKTLPDTNRTPTAAKSRSGTDSPATNAPVQIDGDGKISPFALPLPGNRPSAPVATAVLDSDISASVRVSGDGGASDDAELSAFSQYLGPEIGDSLARAGTARQSSFITQLKASLQALPPHEQIAVQIQNAMQNGSSRMTVDLQPAELGRVEIKLDVDKDKNVSATIVADRPATLDLLQRDAKALERALQQAGLQADSGSLSFSLRDTGGQSGGQGQGGNGGRGRKADRNAGTVAAPDQPAKTGVVAIADGYADLET